MPGKDLAPLASPNVDRFKNPKMTNFSPLCSDVEMALVESTINSIDMCSGMTPESLIKLFKGMAGGEDKAEGFIKILELGLFNRCFVYLTNIYVKDKSKFLMV